MESLKKFITGSQYRGTFNSATCCMEGYGLYTYPDGSEYRGYFKRGLFDGFGRLKMNVNGVFLIQGVWCEGEIQKVQEITFPDGLRYKGDLLEKQISDIDWRFLTEKDRRYSAELNNGLEPVGPYSYLTATRPARHITPGCYDTEEGIYNPKTGFLYNIPKPFLPHRFVTSKAEREWIPKCARRGSDLKDRSDDLEDLEPAPADAQKIINANLKSMKDVGDRVQGCTCNDVTIKKDYFAKLCPKKITGASSDELSGAEAGMKAMPSTPSLTDASSFSTRSIQQNVKEQVENELQNMKKSQIFTVVSDESTLMDYRVSQLYSMPKTDMSNTRIKASDRDGSVMMEQFS